MRKITKYFIDNSFVVNIISVAIILMGLVSLFSMKRDLISNWQTKTIEVTASLVGAGPAQMEKYVTYPLEKALKDIAEIDKITSETSQGYTKITLHLQDDVKDIPSIEQKAKDEVFAIESSLPDAVEDLRVRHIKQTKAWFNYYSILNFDENNDNHQAWLLRTKDDLSRIDGVASVDTYNWVKELFIKFDPRALGRFEIKIDEVYKRINETFGNYTIDSIKKSGDDYSVEIENKEFDVNTIKEINLKTTPSLKTIKLKDIATVDYRLPKRTNRNYTLGKETISFNIFKHFSADSISLKSLLEKKLKAINKKAPDKLKIISVEDGPSFILRQINALKTNAIFGIILVVLTLYLFLGFRNAAMTSFGLPLAYLFTFIVLKNLGISIDLISVVGMLLVIGIIVDDAIIISEQYMQNLEAGQSPKEAALNAVMVTWKPICGTVATTLIAFAPLIVGTDSMSNILFAIPVVVFTALGISLLESFFILPNHLAHFVKKPKSSHKSKYFSRFRYSYERLLRLSLRFRYIILAGFILTMIGSLYFAKDNINFNFNLNISSESVRFIGELKESESIEESREKIQIIEDLIAEIPKDKYKLYEVSIGQNYTNGKRMSGAKYFSYWISFSQLDENVSQNKKFVNDFLKDELEKLKATNLFERLEVKIHKGGGNESRENIVELSISSANPFNVEEVTSEIKKIIASQKIKGIKSIDLDESLFRDAFIFKPDMNKVQSSGLSLKDISSQLVLYVRNNEVREQSLGPRTIKLYSFIEKGEKLDFAKLNQLPIYLSNGLSLPVKEFGTWFRQIREGTIKHLDLMRKVVIDLPFDKELIKKETLIEKIKDIEADLIIKYPNLTFKTQDADEQSRKNKTSILEKFLYALIGIFFILALVLRSVVQPILICIAIPFGIIGVIWAFYLQQLEINLMAIIGIIGMAGVVVNDSLLLVVTVNKNRKDWFNFHIPQIVVGSSSRLRAIILTSITTLGGVFPMAYALGGDAGFTKGLAMSMGWGLLFATVLTLIVLPCLLLVQRDFIVFFQTKIMRKSFSQAIEAQTKNIDSNKEKNTHQLEIHDF